MFRDNSFIWFILLLVIFFNCGGGNSNPLNFDTLFNLQSSAPFFNGTNV